MDGLRLRPDGRQALFLAATCLIGSYVTSDTLSPNAPHQQSITVSTDRPTRIEIVTVGEELSDEKTKISESPRGTFVVFRYMDHGKSYLLVENKNGESPMKFRLSVPYISDVEWSPNDKFLVFKQDNDLVLVNLLTRNTRSLNPMAETIAPGMDINDVAREYEAIHSPRFSPNARFIAFRASAQAVGETTPEDRSLSYLVVIDLQTWDTIRLGADQLESHGYNGNDFNWVGDSSIIIGSSSEYDPSKIAAGDELRVADLTDMMGVIKRFLYRIDLSSKTVSGIYELERGGGDRQILHMPESLGGEDLVWLERHRPGTGVQDHWTYILHYGQIEEGHLNIKQSIFLDSAPKGLMRVSTGQVTLLTSGGLQKWTMRDGKLQEDIW